MEHVSVESKLLVIIDLEWVTHENGLRYIYQISASELFGRFRAFNVFTKTPIQSDAFSTVPKEALESGMEITDALRHFWLYIAHMRSVMDCERAYLIAHGAFSGDKEVLEETIKRTKCNSLRNIWWVDSKRMCEHILQRLEEWQQREDKHMSVPNIHSYILEKCKVANWPKEAYHQAQNDVIALQNVIRYLWNKNLFSGTACPLFDIPFVDSKHNDISVATEIHLLENGVTNMSKLTELFSKHSLASIGLSKEQIDSITNTL